ncbi:MAG: Fe-S cluster assembly scaffold protein NifU [Candidatus Omnitrophica bacterium]|nr:Fe-S cluster assembly scaffold protein NifU [Candidatus Omnitrophota bacterium]
MAEEKDKILSAYSEKVMDHFLHPRNCGEIPDPDGIGNVGNAVCGDIMRMYLKVENDIIVDAKFKTMGCGAAIATSSMVTEMVKGKTITEALMISNRAVAEALGGLPPVKMHCSVLAEQALRAALADYYKRIGKDPGAFSRPAISGTDGIPPDNHHGAGEPKADAHEHHED